MEGTTQNIILALQNIYTTLDDLEAKGKRNHTIIVAVMNSIEQILKALEGKEVVDHGDVHTESES